MKDMQFWVIILAAGSLYWNYLLCKKLKVVEVARQDDYKIYLSQGNKRVDDYKTLEKNKNKEIEEWKETCKFFKGISEKKIRRVDKLTEIRDDLEEKYSNLEWAYDELLNSYKKIDKELYYWRLITAPKPIRKNQFLFYNKNKAIGLR